MDYNFFFKSAVLVKKNKIKIFNLKKPILKKGQVFVKILFSSLCHTQVQEINGQRGIDKFLPHCFGHEGVGKIIDKDKSVKKINKGDIVSLSWIKSSGIEAGGVTYTDENNVKVNGGPVHTSGEYAVISENRIYKLNSKKNLSSKILLGCAMSTTYNSLEKFKKEIKKKILILGAGGLGISALIIANKLGFSEINILDKSKKKLRIAKKLGAKNIFEKFENINKQKFDIVLECTGNFEVLSMAQNYTKNFGGELIIIGNYVNKKKISFDIWPIILGVTISGAWQSNILFDKKFKFIENNILNQNFNHLFGNRIYTIFEFDKILYDLKNNNILRPLIKNN